MQTLLLLAAFAFASHTGAASPQPKAQPHVGCVPDGSGYLRARVRGAITLDLNWSDARMECAGGPRPDSKGVRVSIGGPDRGAGRRIRFVFGLANVAEGANGSAVPTNVTVIFEGEKRIFTTQGDDKCTLDALRQERIATLSGPIRSYRITARGFCTGPATTLTRGERIWISSFDFVGRTDFEEAPRHATPAKAVRS